MQPHRRQRGFTLLELLVVLAIIALAAALIAPALVVAPRPPKPEPADFCGKAAGEVAMVIEAGTGSDVLTFIAGTTDNTLNSLEAGHPYFVFLLTSVTGCDFGG